MSDKPETTPIERTEAEKERDRAIERIVAGDYEELTDDEAMRDEAELSVGMRVHRLDGDGPMMKKFCGAAVVLALDGEWPGDPPCANRPSAWIRYTSPDGYFRYRSVDICELEIANDPD